MKNFKLDRKQGAATYWINYEGTNKKGEMLVIELTKCTNPGGKNSLPELWKKNNYIDRVLETYWHLSTYVRDNTGCFSRYNPQIIYYSRYHKGECIENKPIINFDWMFEATEENAIKLLKEVERVFLTCEETKKKVEGTKQ